MVTLLEKQADVDPRTLRYFLIKGLKPYVKRFVLQHRGQCHSLDDIKFARVAEATIAETGKEISTLM